MTKIRVRALHKKERSGCITCKTRRVKCDESKPACLRCRKYGVVCDGYERKARADLSSSSNGSFAANAKVLLPRAGIALEPSISLFDSVQEQRYFALFTEKIISSLLPYFDSTVWRHMLLQACASEPSIRHAAAAIGALGKTFETLQTGRGRRPGVTHHRGPTLGGPLETAQRVRGKISRKEQVQEATSHHQFALEQYQKSIKKMQGIATGNNIRTVLISCIIIVCFEVLHGNQESASAQLQSGVGLLQDWKQKQRDASKHPIGFSSPAPNTIEDYLVQCFGRLEIQAMSFQDRRPVECHIGLKEEGKEVIQQMPNPLTSINQAQVYLDLLMRRMMHFTASINHLKVSYAQYKNTSTVPDEHETPQADSIHSLDSTHKHAESLSNAPMPWIDSKVVLQPAQHPFSALSLHYSEQEALNSEMGSWFAAFSPILTKSIAKGGRECISALTLSLAATASFISLSAAFIKTETEYDIFEPEFNTIVTHAALLLQTLEDCMPQNRPTLAFSLDLGVLPPLYLTVVKCRISEIREKALQLLTKYPRREGVWDSVTTAALGTWVTEMEKGEDSVGGFVPEEDRVRKASIAFDLVKRKGMMTCLRIDKETGELVERRKNITW